MKAAVLRAAGQALTVEDVEIDAPGPTEVVVRVAAAGLCRSDLHYVEGRYEIETPVVLGHESAGVIEEVGSEVDYVVPGDEVITYITQSCGVCPCCVEGASHNCMNRTTTASRSSDEPPRLTAGGAPVTQFLGLSSFGERLLIDQKAVVKIGGYMPLDRAALLGCGVAAGLGAVINTAKVKKGQTVAVIGCGGVGLAAVQGARIAEASRVIAIDVIEEKLDLASSVGATDAVNGRDVDAVAKVIELSDGLGVHHAIEALGSQATAESAFNMLRRGGVATIVGLLPPGTRLEINGNGLYFEKKLQGSNMGSMDFRRDIPKFIKWYAGGDLLLDEMVTRRLSLDEINLGFDHMRAGLSARSIVVFD